MNPTPIQKVAPAEQAPPPPARRAPARRPGRGRSVGMAILALVALAAALAGWRLLARKPKLQLETARVDKGRIVAKVTATGTLSALVTVQVGSQVSGRVAALYADYNARVKKGQLIAKIDPALFDAAVQQARANLAAARGNLAKAKAQAVDARRQAQRSAALAREKLVAQADADTALANAEAAEAGVEAANGAVAQARATLHQAEVNLAYTDIFSPTNGVVISRSVDVGQTVAASLQAPTLFVIAEDLAKMQVDTNVAEADVGRLRDGMPVTFTVDAHPAEVFRGVVRQIRNSPQTVQNVVTYDAVVDVENPELKLRPGMTANVTFVYAEKDDVVRVPNAALRFRPAPDVAARLRGASGGKRAGAEVAASPPAGGGAAEPAAGGRRARGGGAEPPDRRTVWVVRGEGVAQPVRVRTGISDGSTTELAEVVEGELRPGDSVVTDVVGGGGPAPGAAPRGPRIL